jgi:hypothetical protein
MESLIQGAKGFVKGAAKGIAGMYAKGGGGMIIHLISNFSGVRRACASNTGSLDGISKAIIRGTRRQDPRPTKKRNIRSR